MLRSSSRFFARRAFSSSTTTSSSSPVKTTSEGVVVLEYNDLVADKDLSASIDQAYNYDGVGLLVVTGVPGFVEARAETLPLASRLAALPRESLEKLEDAESQFSVGWSHGKEMIKEGRPDTHKGSFYANPTMDTPSSDEEFIKRFPAAARPNVWPSEDLPELEGAFKKLGSKIVDVGALVARQCDFLTRKTMPESAVLERTVRESNSIKARLLHYFPVNEDLGMDKDTWCTWHNDHGSLTGLCSAMFLPEGEFEASAEIENPDDEAGLYARTRKGEEVRVRIPRDAIAYQIGETSQITSGGLLRATPHAVAPIRFPQSKGIARNTLAVFMQPAMTDPIKLPAGVTAEQTGIDRFKEGMDFSQFHEATINQYYGIKKD